MTPRLTSLIALDSWMLIQYGCRADEESRVIDPEQR